MRSRLLDLFNVRCDTDDEEHVPHTAQGLYKSNYRHILEDCSTETGSTLHILMDYWFDNLIGLTQLSLHAWVAGNGSCSSLFLFQCYPFSFIIICLFVFSIY